MNRETQAEKGGIQGLLGRTEASDDSDSDLSAAELIGMVARRKWFVIACTLLCALAGYLYARSSTALYEATASIRIDPGRANSLGLSDLLSGATADNSDLIRTEVAVLQSDTVAIAALNGLSDQDFTDLTGTRRSVPIPVSTADITKQQEKIVGSFKTRLQVKGVIDTQLIAISFRDKDPQLAATVVNHLVDAYQTQTLNSRYHSVQQVQTWLGTQMEQLKKNSADAQERLAKFQEQHSILGTGAPLGAGPSSPSSPSTATATTTTTTDRLRLLNEKLTGAEADRIVKEAQMRAAMTADSSVLATMFPDQKLQALQTQRATLFTQYASLSTKFGVQYAPLIQIKNELSKVDAEIKRDTELVQNRLKEDYDASRRAEDMLRSEYADQTGRAYALNREQAELSNLEAAGSASGQLYNTLQVKLQQAGVDAGLSGVNTMLVDVARPPLLPTGASKSTTVLIGAMLGLILSLASVFLIEFLSENLQNSAQMVKSVGAPLMGTIPHHTVKTGKNSADPAPAMIAMNYPQSREADAYRTLRNLLMESTDARSLKSLLVTSPAPGEGKTTIASNLAVVLAQSGAKVLLIDAEFARPSLHSAFGCETASGLGDLLLGRPASFLQPVSSLPNLSLLAVGSTKGFSTDALPNRFPTLLHDWKSTFDHVVIKTAPLLLVSDGLLLAKWADGILMIGRRDVTSIKELQKVSAMLKHLNANIMGTVLNDATGTADVDGKYQDYGMASEQ